MKPPIVVALTDDYVLAVTVHLAQRDLPLDKDAVRAALEAAAGTTARKVADDNDR